MTSIDTRVQMLNLRAPDEATAQRLSTLVEEAIRMAALDADIPASVFVVRQLDLSSIPRAAPPAALAHAVDVAVERVVANAVSADDPGASAAPMVYFKNDDSVVLALARRVANSRPSAEWFWPAVVKEWRPNAPVDRAIPLLVERALATSGGVVTLAGVVEMLASTGVIDKLLERLSPADGRALLKAIGWTEAMVSGRVRESEHAEPQTMRVPQHSERLVQRWVGRWGGDPKDPRAIWLGAMLLVADRPARATSAELPESVKVWLAAVLEQSREATGEEPRDSAAARAVQREDLIADTRAWLQSHPRSPLDSLFGGGPPLLRPTHDPNARVDRRSPNDQSGDDEAAPDAPPTWKTPRHTRDAGLLFLIPLLTRVGLTTIVATTPELIDRDWPSALFLRLARRLGVPQDDPAVVCLAPRATPLAHTDRALTAEVVRATRIRLRNEAGLTLRSLVHRDGAIVASRTTIDVLLVHAEPDAGVRRAGLHTDASDIPWLGRAVVFHYHDAVDVNA